MSQYDIPWLWQALRGDIASFVTVPDRTHQGVLNHLLVVQLLKGAFATDPNVIFNGASVIDPSRVYYWGISQGGVLVRVITPIRAGGVGWEIGAVAWGDRRGWVGRGGKAWGGSRPLRAAGTH